MTIPTLITTAQALLAPGKGILAADESSPTIEKRFKDISLPSTEENRRAYREMLFTTPEIGKYISGVILFDETIRQRLKDGTPMPLALSKQGIIPGIKVDEGAVSLTNFPGEKITHGLDGLRERLADYRNLGARFTKWRAVITIGKNQPSQTALQANAAALAQYAALSQEADLVPIVEPEVLMDGDHTIARCEEVITATLKTVFDALFEYRIALEGMLLKSGMVLSGKECAQQAGISEVAEATIRTFRRTVPSAVPGIVFLSGGQSDIESTERLNAICADGNLPWKLTFSFGRALQAPSLQAWKGLPAQVGAGQTALHHRSKCNSLALTGGYSDKVEKAG